MHVADTECKAERLQYQQEIDRATQSAVTQRAQMTLQLTELQGQLEVQHEQHKTEINAALDRNRALAKSLELRPKSDCRRRPVSAPTDVPGGSTGTDTEREFSTALTGFSVELAAEADRVREIADQCQQRARQLGEVYGNSH